MVEMHSADRNDRSMGLITQILIAMVAGSVVGLTFGKQAVPIGVIGDLIIQLIKTLAIPLVFFAILEALVTTVISRQLVGRFFKIIAINSVIAITIGLLLSNVFHAGTLLNFVTMAQGKHDAKLEAFAGRKIEFSEVLSGYIPQSFLTPFADNNMVGIIILALLVGLALRKVLQEADHAERRLGIEGNLRLCNAVFETMLAWLVRIVPIAVFAALCKTVGQYGFAPFKGLLAYTLLGVVGLLMQCFLVYPVWITRVCKIPAARFWDAAKRAIVHAFGTNSSLATLPLTLQALDKLNISRASSRLGACVGTNLNNDGILLYEAMAVLFVAQAHGLHLSIGQQILTALLCLVAAAGVAGVPEAGVISLSLVLTTTGMPLTILPLLISVDWVIARMRSVTNTMSDMTVSIALDGDRTSKPEPVPI